MGRLATATLRAASSTAILAAAVTLVACGGGSAAGPRSTRPAPPAKPAPAHRLPGRHFVVGCEDPRVTGGLDPGYRGESVIVGPLAIFPARSEFPRLPADDFAPVKRGADPPRFAALEAAVTVAPGARVTPAIPRREQKTLALLFDHSRYGDANRGYSVAEGDRAVTFPGCFRPYTQYQGGFVVAKAQCADMIVYGAGMPRARHTKIAFGAVPGC